MTRANYPRCIRCNKPMANRVQVPCDTIVCSEMCASIHMKGCRDCAAAQLAASQREAAERNRMPRIRLRPGDPTGPSMGLVLSLVGGAILFFIILSTVVLLKQPAATATSERSSGKVAYTEPPKPTLPPTNSRPPDVPKPQPPLEPPVIKAEQVSEKHKGQLVRVRGQVTQVEAGQLTLEDVLVCTLTTDSLRVGQVLTIEGVCFVVAGKPKLSRCQVLKKE